MSTWEPTANKHFASGLRFFCRRFPCSQYLILVWAFFSYIYIFSPGFFSICFIWGLFYRFFLIVFLRMAFLLEWGHRRCQDFCLGGGTCPTPPCHSSVAHTFEAVAGSWGSVSAPAVMCGAPERKEIAKKYAPCWCFLLAIHSSSQLETFTIQWTHPLTISTLMQYRPLSRRLDRCDRVIQDEVGDSNGGNV